MNCAPFLQSVVAPICRFSQSEERITIEQIHGTGFFVTGFGHFLTARHVLEAALGDTERNGGMIAIFPMQIVNGIRRNMTACPVGYDFADEPYDVAICKTLYDSPTFYKLQEGGIEVWQDVSTIGYPVSATFKGTEQFEVQARVHKGYIQRIVPRGRMRSGSHPDAYELSFAISHGMSGAPLFIHAGDYDRLIGICIGSINSRIVDYESVIFEEGEVSMKEQIVRVEEFGVAHNMMNLLDWKPKCLDGLSLQDASNQYWRNP